MKNFRPILNPSRIILWHVGYISHDEQAPSPSQPRLDPVILRLDHPLVDGDAYHPIHIYIEFFDVDIFGRWVVFRIHRRGNVGENKERVKTTEVKKGLYSY